MKKTINRTVKTRIRTTEFTMVYYNPLSPKLEVSEMRSSIQKTFKTKDSLVNAVKKAFNSDEVVVIDCRDIKKTDAIYECSFEDFMNIATFVENVDVKEK